MPSLSSITVVVPVYNGADVLPKTVPAMFGQSVAARWVFVDDGSTDGTDAVLDALIDGAGARDRVRVCTHASNRGRAAARNTGLDAVDTPLVAFMDADVAPLAGYLDRMVMAFEHPDVIAAVGRLEFAEGDPSDPYVRYLQSSKRGPRPGMEKGPLAWRYFLLGIAAVRTGAVREVGAFDERLTYGEDLELGARLAERWPGGLRWVPEARARLYDVGTLDVALGKMTIFGRDNLPLIVDRHPGMAGQVGVDVVDSASGIRHRALRALLRPGVARAVRRLLPHLPAPWSDYAIRYLLGFTLAHHYREGRRRIAA